MKTGSPPILARIVALVAGTMLLALAAMLVVTFRGPPPHPRPLDMEDIAQLLTGGNRPDSGWAVRSMRSAQLADPPEGLRIDAGASAALARILGVRPDAVRMMMPDPGGPDFRGEAEIRDHAIAALNDGGGWTIITIEQRPATSWYAITLSLMVGIFVLLLIPALLVARRIVRPIQALAAFAQSAQTAETDFPDVGGPPEVERLRDAFNGMGRRLADQAAERTHMFAAIAHDLRTPMTRLSFRIEGLPEVARAKAQSDVEEMRTMVAAMLDFARGEAAPVAQVRLDLAALLHTIADDLTDIAEDVQIVAAMRAVIQGDPALLRRCIGNVVENALRYAGSARLQLDVEGDRAVVRVTDAGPGIAPDKIARLCEPFFRAEESRNRATGGVGLGLSIARTITERHGGTIGFANRPEGGLAVTIRLPLAPG